MFSAAAYDHSERDCFVCFELPPMTILTVIFCMFSAAAYDHSERDCFVCFELLPMAILTVIVLYVFSCCL